MRRGKLMRLLVRLIVPIGVLSLIVAPGTVAAHSLAAASTNNNPLCSRLGVNIQLSSGAQMWCKGAQPTTPPQVKSGGATSAIAPFSKNVNAANPSEDVAPNGTRAYGQSETSIAANGSYVVEAWNDSTGFFSPCPSPSNKEEITGFGFSNNGGSSFTDLGGPPNNNCAANEYEGDPFVESWTVGGHVYFYIGSLYPSVTGSGLNDLAMAACQVIGSGTSAHLSCGQPTIIAESTECTTSGFCSFLDKEFATLDPVHGRMYVSYSEFGFSNATLNGSIDVAVCDLGTSTGGPGPSGGTPGRPVCHFGTPANPTTGAPGRPYFVVAPGTACENEGAYPAVYPSNQNVYVAYEYNWATNIFNFAPCNTSPTLDVMTRTVGSCFSLTVTFSPCSGPTKTNSVPIVSMTSAFIPGYNRFPMNDFPRIAVNGGSNTVAMVWNDARLHPNGDILLQSFNATSLAGIQSKPVALDNDKSGAVHILPALRYVDSSGNLDVSWYDRRPSANTTITNVYAALAVNPRTTTTPSTNYRVTDVASDWNAVSSDIIPNFGDYTDNFIIFVTSGSHHGAKIYVAWSDGRLGVPQPFNSHATIP